jgi:hypothetical protein
LALIFYNATIYAFIFFLGLFAIYIYTYYKMKASF